MTPGQRKQGTLLVLLAAALWGLIGLFVKSLTELGLSELQVLLCRLALSVLLLFTYLLIRDPAQLRVRLRDLWMFVGTGMLSLLFFNWCYFSAMGVMGVSVAVVLLYTSPVFVMLFSAALFGERMTRRKLLALLCALLSCVCISGLLTGGGGMTGGGLLLGLGAGFGYALYSVFGRIALRRYSSMTITFYTFVFALIGVIPLADLVRFPSAYWGGKGLLSTVCISLFCTVLAYLLYTKGLSTMPAGRAAVLATVEPAVGMMVGILFLGEPMTWGKLLGALLMLAAIVILSTDGGNENAVQGSESGAGDAPGGPGHPAADV